MVPANKKTLVENSGKYRENDCFIERFFSKKDVILSLVEDYDFKTQIIYRNGYLQEDIFQRYTYFIPAEF